MHWTRVALRAFFSLLVVVYSTAADAAMYLLGDSMMSVVEENGRLTIAFLQPGDDAKARGIKPGEILFEGMVSRTGYLSGTAYAFKKGCLPEPYAFDVKGNYTNYGIEFFGAPPVFALDSCAIRGYSDSGSGNHLILSITQ